MKQHETVQVRNLSAGAICIAHVTLPGGELGAINAKRFQLWFDKGGKRLFDAGLVAFAQPAAAAAPSKPAAPEPVEAPAPEPVTEPAPIAEVEEAPAAAEEADDEPKRGRTTRRR